jgi:trk system potassium uptake protein TrkH
MSLLLQKLPFILELILTGPFIILYLLAKSNRIPFFYSIDFIPNVLEIQSKIIPFFVLLSIIVNYLNTKHFESFFRKNIFSFLIFVPLIITWDDLEFTFWLSSLHLLSSTLTLYEPITKKAPKAIHFAKIQSIKTDDPLLKIFQLAPAQIVLLTFAILILVGAFLLVLPLSSATGNAVSFVDALFMSTSAACVTGLATISPSSDLSFFGQIVLLILVQVGGLGTMILYASMTILMGKNMPIKEQLIMQDILDVSTLEELIGVIIAIIKYTFVIELWAAIILTFAFTIEGFEFSKSLYFGFYHSITAFCNAGFALFDDNLESFATTPMINLTIAFTIILGGIGFSVLKETKQVLTGKKTYHKMSAHTKIVLTTTFILLVIGTVFIFFSEFLSSMDSLTLWEKFQISFFQSVTLRTAGFNTINLTLFNPHTLYILIMFMFIGGSPGSTAGGIKTTSLAILVQSIRSTLKGQGKVQMFNRTIADSIVVKTTAIFMLALMITSLFVTILLWLEPKKDLLGLLFEVISAFGTVGLSLNVTPYLSSWGKLMIALVMYIGRVGPLTLVIGLGQKSQDNTSQVEYPIGKVMIG